MSRKLPPLNALCAFEDAGRRASMSTITDELAVTPAAVSHQVKTLEEYFSIPLFHRAVCSTRLTGRRAALLPYLSEGLGLWVERCRKLAALDDNAQLVIWSTPEFAKKCLDAIGALVDAGVPVTIMAAPMIPHLNDYELKNLLNAATKKGPRRLITACCVCRSN
jgi:hypothetical protein